MAKTDVKTYVAYLRQSTRKQEASGLGIVAQREIIQSYLKGESILEEYIETETGTRSDRPKLMATLLSCRRQTGFPYQDGTGNRTDKNKEPSHEGIQLQECQNTATAQMDG